MARDGSTIALEADPDDPEDFPVTVDGVEQGLAERRERMRARGQQVAPLKQAVSIRLDQEVVDRFRVGGPGWQTRMNEALRRAVGL